MGASLTDLLIYSVEVTFVAKRNWPGSRPLIAARARVIICTGKISTIGKRPGKTFGNVKADGEES